MGARKLTYEKCVQVGKLCFPTKGDALLVLKKPNVRGLNSKKRKKREKRAYECEFCGFWHLTSAEYFKKELLTKKTKNVQKDSKRTKGKIGFSGGSE